MSYGKNLHDFQIKIESFPVVSRLISLRDMSKVWCREVRVWSDVQCTLRLLGSVAKTLLILHVNRNGANLIGSSPSCLDGYSVEERTITRWSPERRREDQALKSTRWSPEPPRKIKHLRPSFQEDTLKLLLGKNNLYLKRKYFESLLVNVEDFKRMTTMLSIVVCSCD
ncbi:tRNA-splicing endonuclease subunit Sen2-1-like protein isoform X2 [Tanacetum coccineum]|uniref:tRNA-splicing endonuclease subunit Sen2-1-like protein isoform X2 n=1 Tax=Tanacetum coccineum TaxID=301880 RepID=A0ABQ4X459_9ASTR